MTVINRVLKGGGDGKKYGADISTFLGDVDSNGILQNGNTTDLVFKGVKDIGAISSTAGVLVRRFQYNTGIKSVSFPDLEKVTADYGIANTFYGCTGLTSVDLSSLKEVSGNYAFNYSFSGCTGLTSVDLSSLTTVGLYGLGYMFNSCTGLTSVVFSSLTDISIAAALKGTFYNCTSLTDVYFPALTTLSFGNNFSVQFDDLLGNVTGCTLHFPSNLSSIISQLVGYPNFNGTNTVLAFDLPATE